MSDSTPTTQSWPFEFLQKIGNYLLGVTLLCYLTGFAITNLFLGPLGIVNLDLLRARYILAGFLFLLFLSAIAYLVYGLIQTLQKHQQKSALDLIGCIIWHSFQNIAVLWLAILALAILPGSVSRPPIGIPKLSPITPWSDWLRVAPAFIVQHSVLFYGAILLGVVILVAVIIIINPKDKYDVRKPRRQVMAEALKQTRLNKGKVFGLLLGGFVLVCVWNFLGSFLGFIASNKISSFLGSSTSLLSGGWLRFFGAIIGIYSLVAIYLTFLFIQPSSSKQSDDENPLARTSSLIYLVTIAIVFIVPMYSLGIYPNLPQQIGGGHIMRVDANISSNELNRDFSNTCIEIYLIDRTSNSSLFFLMDTAKQAHKVIEVSGDLIQSVTYKTFP